jgi:alpha-tubulin suppressor-like RCC1 family protein
VTSRHAVTNEIRRRERTIVLRTIEETASARDRLRVSHAPIVAFLLTAITLLLTIVRPATAQVVDPTGSNFAIWGSPSFNRQIGPDDSVVQVGAGYLFTVALLSDGSVACWGWNEFGQCNVPTGIGTPENPVVSVAAGHGYHAVAMLQDGSVACWGATDGGYNDYGQSSVPDGVGTVENPVARVAAGIYHTVAVLANGSVACWGSNDSGQCDVPGGIGTPENPVTGVAAGDWHTVAILADGSVVCWGSNYFGQCDVPGGIGTPENPVASVAAGLYHTVAVLADGSVACWGWNYYGQCDVPAGIGTPENPVASVAAGGYHTVALLADGSLAWWGAGFSGLDHVSGGIGTPLNPVANIAAGGLMTLAATAPCDLLDALYGDAIDVPGEVGSLRLAISLACDGTTIRLAPGTYANNIHLPIDFGGKAITIEGDVADPSAVVLDGTGLEGTSVVRMVTGEGAGSVLRGVTIRNGTSGTPFGGTLVGGAMHTFESSPTVEDCVFESNAASYGGAVYARGGAPAFRNCVFRDNTAEFDGGAFQFSRTTGGVLDGCTFEQNLAGNNGGAVHLFGGDPVLTGCTITGNNAGNGGGGVSWASTGEPGAIVDSLIAENVAAVGGGLWIAGKAADLTLIGTTVCDNLPDDVDGPFTDGGGNDTCSCPGDFDHDGDVDGEDLGAWLAFIDAGCSQGSPCPGDLDGDGEVRGSDLGVLLLNWGLCD